jgi:hypothetical protein
MASENPAGRRTMNRSPLASKRYPAIELCLTIVLLIAIFTPAAIAADTNQTSIAVVAFDYLDTSGESRNQVAYHTERIAELANTLRADLERSGRFKVVAITCTPAPCSLTETEPAELVGAARRAGARLLLFGGVHKQSTLVQWAKIQVLEVPTEKLLYERHMSFRGDDETAWKRLEQYMMKELLAQSWPSPEGARAP